MSKIYLLCLIVLFLSPILIFASDLATYYSPGVQIGYSKDQGLFVSTQISLGAGYRDIAIFPGATIGPRFLTGKSHYSNYSFNDED